MIFTRIKKAIALGLAAVSAMSMTALADTPSAEIYALSQEEANARGFQIIDEDIYSLDGVLLIDMTNGFTPDGYELDADFSVQTPDMHENADAMDIMPMSLDIFDGGITLSKNVDGNQGVILGDSFKGSAGETKAYLTYYSGEPTGVNFGIYNKTRNTVVEYVYNIKPGKTSKGVTVYNSSHPNDSYVAQTSGYQSSGYASLYVELK